MKVISALEEFDIWLFLKLNALHHPFLDPLMFLASHKFTWLPLYFILILIVWKHFGMKSWLIYTVVLFLIVCTDQLSVFAFKDIFLRYRPCHNLLIQSQIHMNGSCGGTYGFISSHAANTFGLAGFLFLLLKDKIRPIGFWLFIWALIVSYSRIYNGVHYPADIAVGAILGLVLAFSMFKLYKAINIRML